MKRLIVICPTKSKKAAVEVLRQALPTADLIAPLNKSGKGKPTHFAGNMAVDSADFASLATALMEAGAACADGDLTSYRDMCAEAELKPII